MSHSDIFWSVKWESPSEGKHATIHPSETGGIAPNQPIVRVASVGLSHASMMLSRPRSRTGLLFLLRVSFQPYLSRLNRRRYALVRSTCLDFSRIVRLWQRLRNLVGFGRRWFPIHHRSCGTRDRNGQHHLALQFRETEPKMVATASVQLSVESLSLKVSYRTSHDQQR
jgi:hypothetical protein